MFYKFSRALKNRKGFTLVELMVVVVIIGILAGIAVPVYTGVQNRAKQGAGEANATILNNGIKQWEMANNDTYNQAEDQNNLLTFLGVTAADMKYVKWDTTQNKYVVDITDVDGL